MAACRDTFNFILTSRLLLELKKTKIYLNFRAPLIYVEMCGLKLFLGLLFRILRKLIAFLNKNKFKTNLNFKHH